MASLNKWLHRVQVRFNRITLVIRYFLLFNLFLLVIFIYIYKILLVF